MFVFQWIWYLDAFLFFDWDMDQPLCTYGTGAMEGVVHPKYLELQTRGISTYKKIYINWKQYVLISLDLLTYCNILTILQVM